MVRWVRLGTTARPDRGHECSLIAAAARLRRKTRCPAWMWRSVGAPGEMFAGLWWVDSPENTPTRAATLFGWGVDSVITDRPDRIRASGNDS